MIKQRPNNRYQVTIRIHGKERVAGTFSEKEAKMAKARLEVGRQELEALPEMRVADPVRRVAKGESVSQASGMTCDSYVDEFIASREAQGRARSTIINYRSQLKSFKKSFVDTDLCDVDRLTARQWADTQPFSTVKLVRSVFYHAIDDGILSTNPFAKLGLRPNRRIGLALREEEVYELAETALDEHPSFPQFASLLKFAAFTGLRLGEICALKWANVDLERDEILVRDNLVLGEEKRPKNDKIRRVILPPPAKTALKEIPRRVDSNYVFVNQSGGRLSKGSINHYWRTTRAAFGKQRINVFHELRHTAATMLLERGVSHFDVSVQLGHTDGGALVMRTYGHPSHDAARERLKRSYGMNIRELKKASNG